MIQDIISACSIICDLKEIAKKAKIRSLRKLLDIRYMYMDEVEKMDIVRWCFCYGI